MATFEDVLNKVKDVALATGEKATEIANKTKIKMEISSLQKKLAATYEGIGRLVYDAETAGDDIAALKAEAFDTVKELQAEIDAMQDKLYEMEGAVRCGGCNAVNENDADFCKKCGAKL